MHTSREPPCGATLCDALVFPRNSREAATSRVAIGEQQCEQAPLISPVGPDATSTGTCANDANHNAVLRTGFWWLVPSAIIGTIGQCILTPILPQLMQQYFQTGHAAAAVQGWTDSLGYALGFLAAGVMGKVSDSHGRKPILVTQKIAVAIAMATLAFKKQLKDNVWWYLAARILVSVVTGCSLYQPSAVWNAYLADCYPGQKRIVYFGVSMLFYAEDD